MGTAPPTIDKNMTTLSSFPFPPTKPNMFIKPKVFSITFWKRQNTSTHLQRIQNAIHNNNDLADKEMLRSLCPQVIQLRKIHQDDDVYQIIIENISNWALKTNLLMVVVCCVHRVFKKGFLPSPPPPRRPRGARRSSFFHVMLYIRIQHLYQHL
jgi:hypothetical protein